MVVIVVVAGAYLLSGRGSGPASGTSAGAPAATTSAALPAGLDAGSFPLPGATSSAPGVVEGAPVKHTVHITLAFAQPTFTSSSSYPTLSGTGGNVSSAEIEILDAAGKGLVASTVAIENGRWSYAPPVALPPGTYTALLGTQGLVVKATVVVTQG